jgi:hypothetical protein
VQPCKWAEPRHLWILKDCCTIVKMRQQSRSSEEGRVELQIRPAKPGYRLKSFAAQLLLGPHPAKIDETDAPAVVVISSSGEEQVLQRTGTDRQAQAALRRFEAKRQKLGDLEYCRVYGIPERFAE